MRGERGAAMLIALGALALIAALSAATLSAATGPAARATAAVEQAKALRAAEAAAHRLAAAMARDDLRGVALMDGAVVSTAFLGADIDFAAQDAAGLIDVNLAPQAMLERVLTAVGAARPEAIAAAWVEARAAGGDRRGFRALEDAVAALSPDLQAEAAPALAHMTAHGQRAAVDPWVATAPALAAAGDIPLETAQAFVAARTVAGRRAAPPQDLDPDGLAASDGRVARLTVRAETPGGGRAEIVAVLRATRSPRAPLSVLSWR